MINHDEYVPVAINSRIETEEVLGPLPENWEKAAWGKTGRFYFVDHNSKLTTWVDPRTYHLRKHDIRDIVPGELPYAWEEAFDPACGIFYIDHISQTQFADAPWEDHIKEEVIELHKGLQDESKKLEEQMQLAEEKKAELQQAEERLVTLEAEKARIVDEIAALNGENPGELEAEKEAIEQRIEEERQECEQVANEHARINAEIEQFQTRLQELRAVNERLENENKDLVEQVEENAGNIDEMRNLIEMEAAQRNALEQYIKQLKNEVLQLYDPQEADLIQQKESQMEETSDHMVVDAPLPVKGTLEKDQEISLLKSRLDNEKNERERLKQLTETLEQERQRVQQETEQQGLYALPDWIKELNIADAENSTVRVRVSKNPDDMDYKEKLLKFEAQAVESGEGPKVPVDNTEETPQEVSELEEAPKIEARQSQTNVNEVGGQAAEDGTFDPSLQANDGVVVQSISKQPTEVDL